MDIVEDLTIPLVRTFGMQDPAALAVARKELVEGPFTLYLGGLDRRLASGGGEYFADGRLTVADLKVFVVTRHVSSGGLDHVPADLLDTVAPLLASHRDRIAADPRVVAYYAG